jgi:hypothetical protein
MTIQKRRKARATAAEQKIANDLGGRKTFLSGAGDEKADVVVPSRVQISNGVLHDSSLFSFRIEVKTTHNSKYTLSSSDWEKLLVAAEKAGQAPVFVMEIGIGSPSAYMKFAAINSDFFQELTGWNQTPRLTKKDTGRRSMEISRGIRTDGWKVGNTPCRRVWFQLSTPSKKGDITIIAYDDFLRLVQAAERQWAKEQR